MEKAHESPETIPLLFHFPLSPMQMRQCRTGTTNHPGYKMLTLTGALTHARTPIAAFLR